MEGGRERRVWEIDECDRPEQCSESLSRSAKTKSQTRARGLFRAGRVMKVDKPRVGVVRGGGGEAPGDYNSGAGRARERLSLPCIERVRIRESGFFAALFVGFWEKLIVLRSGYIYDVDYGLRWGRVIAAGYMGSLLIIGRSCLWFDEWNDKTSWSWLFPSYDALKLLFQL